jgi:membrane protein DedA with SNARE-associated domain
VLTFLSLAAGTLISEDLAGIAAGLLIERGEVTAFTGVAACAVGIFAGDLGLWIIGRVCGRSALRWPWMARRLRHAGIDGMRLWLERHAAAAILGSRFLPGSRLPLYVLAGFVKLPARVFAWWSLLAVLIWTPALVLFTATLGDALVTWLAPVLGGGWVPRLVTAGGVLLLLRSLHHIGARRPRFTAMANPLQRGSSA